MVLLHLYRLLCRMELVSMPDELLETQAGYSMRYASIRMPQEVVKGYANLTSCKCIKLCCGNLVPLYEPHLR